MYIALPCENNQFTMHHSNPLQADKLMEALDIWQEDKRVWEEHLTECAAVGKEVSL